MDKAQENRIARILTVVMAVGIVAAILLFIALRDELFALAQGWPGGPAAFLICLGLAGALGMFISVAAWLFHIWPDRAPWQLRLHPAIRHAITAIGGTAAVLSTVFLIGAMPTRARDPRGCEELSCWLESHEPGSWVWGLVSLGVASWLASLVLVFLFASDSEGRWPALIPEALIGAGLAVLFTVLTLSLRYGDAYSNLAHEWPGGPRLFLIVAGALVSLGVGGAVWAWTHRQRLPTWGTLPLVLAGVAVTAAALSVLIAAVPPRRYPGPYLCDKGFYCALDQTHDQAGLIVGLGWLALPITAALIGYAAFRAAKRSR
ncbi:MULTISPECIES: hypothetical protein [unclassified Streptomyces]|uniref:hypothetical protein n=1 Tax=unclassified Streptomyces TaxID=2593676 RepID=UPI001905E3BD|nr:MULTISPECIES: hypothetical protein [unclassified Streptomyces]MCU4745726.1 hypothetical protein [Streptomyces sp. G-5]QQN79306.1 hypothetical protein IPZ77_19110 [Streptomyces sp. XC 2026]